MANSAMTTVIFFDLGDTLAFTNANGQLQRYADAVDTLQALRGRSYRLGLLSNQASGTTLDQARAMLAGVGLADYIESDLTTISSEIPGNVGKPNQPIFDRALQKAGHPTASGRTIFVTEDSSHIAAARSFGWRAILKRNTGTCQPSDGECVSSLASLLSLLPDISVISIKIASGSTTPGSTNWQAYGSNGVYLDVDTSAGKFATTPRYVTSIGGNSSHWATTGTTSIYNATATGFRVYVRWSDGSALTPVQANSFQWHISWIGVEA